RARRTLAAVGQDGQLTTIGQVGGDTVARQCDLPFEGFLTPTLYYTLCQDANLHRYALDGTARPELFIPRTSIAGLAATNGPLVDTSRGRLYLWDPFERALTAVDGVAGTVIGRVT